MAIWGLGSLGCEPSQVIELKPNTTSGCVDHINQMVSLFDGSLPKLVDDLNKNFPDAHFVYVNTSNTNPGNNPSALGNWNRVSSPRCFTLFFRRLHINDRIDEKISIDFRPLQSRFTIGTRQLICKFIIISGVKVTEKPCCKVGKAGSCIPNSPPCANRNDYSYFDIYHPSEIANLHGILKAYNSTDPLDVYPMSISKLAAL